MGIMDKLFGQAAPAPAPAVKQEDPMAIHNPDANPANVANRPSGTATNGKAEPVTPLDEFKDIWQPVKAGENDDPFSKPLLNHDPAKFNQAVANMNFTAGITQEQLAKAMQDPAELLKVINTASQQAFAAATNLSTQVVEGSHKTNNERMNSTLPKKYREIAVQDTRSDNPVLQHEATAPMLDMAKRSLMARHPDKSPQEIQNMAERYITNFSEALNGNKQAAADKSKAPDPFDFSNFG